MSKRYTIAVDFDGVLSQWDGQWRGLHVVDGPPIPGAIEWLYLTIQHFDISVHSVRCNTWRGRRALRRWIRLNAGLLWHDSPDGLGLGHIRVAKGKPPALVYLDDRAMRFDGPESWPTRQQIHDARPWHKARAQKRSWR